MDPPPSNSDVRDNRDYITALLYSHYTAISGWGVLLTSVYVMLGRLGNHNMFSILLKILAAAGTWLCVYTMKSRNPRPQASPKFTAPCKFPSFSGGGGSALSFSFSARSLLKPVIQYFWVGV